ncbi:GntR family transcriptional regulator [Reyranella sp.]|uniref:GntR family transcriptional regulator n=1 Tax=Reyranella sp. TaxID=1929291 RepID=UPI00403544EE
MAMPLQKTYDIYATLPAQIAVRIGQAIVENEFTPGQKLREIDLAAAFGVSRASVREALRIVEHEGLVTILPQRGAQVTTLSADEVQDIFDIRAHLMGLACERLVAALPRTGRTELERLYADLERSFDDAEAYARASLAISEFCVRNAGSRRLADLILSFGRQTARYTKLSLSTSERRRQSIANWRGLVQSILAGDAKAAEGFARQLVFDTRDTALSMLANGTSEPARPG